MESCSYSCFSAGTSPTKKKERGEGMLHSYFDRELGRERVVQMRTEVEHNRLEARLMASEDRLAKVVSLSEEARRAKARLSEEAVLRKKGMAARGATFVAALFR